MAIDPKVEEQKIFSHKDVVRALIKAAGLKEGIWALYVQFGIAGLNVQNQGGDVNELYPAALVPVQKLGLQRVQKESPLAVDASTVD